VVQFIAVEICCAKEAPGLTVSKYMYQKYFGMLKATGHGTDNISSLAVMPMKISALIYQFVTHLSDSAGLYS
jgi:hypothetical protein